MAYGDNTIPNLTSEDLARAMKLTTVEQTTHGAGMLRAIYRADPKWFLPADESQNYNAHSLLWDAPELRRQAIDFLVHRGTRVVVE
jgi:hypothetical protein